MRENKLMLIDAPMRKIAVFANNSGHVVLAVDEDGHPCIATLCVDEFDDFIERFKKAQAIALEIDSHQSADFAIWKARTE